MTWGAPPSGPTLSVTVTSSRLNLTARDARLGDVLLAIGQQSGVKLVLGGSLDTPITETLVNVPLDVAIQRLSRWHAVVLIYEGPDRSVGAPALIEAWVTGPHPSISTPMPAAAGPAHRDPTPNTRAATAAAPRLSEESERWTRTLIAFKDANAETRTQQIDDLVKAHGEQAIVAALREVATRDPAPRARRSAVRVLASIEGPGARAALEATLNDSNPGVRSEARAALRRQGRAHASDAAVD